MATVYAQVDKLMTYNHQDASAHLAKLMIHVKDFVCAHSHKHGIPFSLDAIALVEEH
jgi:hypothetical protein